MNPEHITYKIKTCAYPTKMVINFGNLFGHDSCKTIEFQYDGQSIDVPVEIIFLKLKELFNES